MALVATEQLLSFIILRRQTHENYQRETDALRNSCCRYGPFSGFLRRQWRIFHPFFFHSFVYRFYGNDTGKAIADYITVYDETVDDTKDLEIFDPSATWKKKTVYCR